jgi:hypothetical protein
MSAAIVFGGLIAETGLLTADDTKSTAVAAEVALDMSLSTDSAFVGRFLASDKAIAARIGDLDVSPLRNGLLDCAPGPE